MPRVVLPEPDSPTMPSVSPRLSSSVALRTARNTSLLNQPLPATKSTLTSRTETTIEALKLTVGEFIRLQQEPVSERELGAAQAFLAGNFALTIETPDAIALKVLNALFYGLDLKDLPAYPDQVYRVSTEDIQRVSRAYLRPSRLAIVLVGDAAKFVPELKKAGFESYEVVKLDDLDLSTVDLKRPQRAAAGLAAFDGTVATLPPPSCQ